jgi:hypothetical protein
VDIKNLFFWIYGKVIAITLELNRPMMIVGKYMFNVVWIVYIFFKQRMRGHNQVVFGPGLTKHLILHWLYIINKSLWNTRIIEFDDYFPIRIFAITFSIISWSRFNLLSWRICLILVIRIMISLSISQILLVLWFWLDVCKMTINRSWFICGYTWV